MDGLKALKESLQNDRPVDWKELPDINLYKDQVVFYLKRQLVGFEESQLTPAMISNYVKDKLIPKAEGKKYNRKHLALLSKISYLKQVLAVKEIDFLIKEEGDGKSEEESYDSFVSSLDKAFLDAASKIDIDSGRKEMVDMAFEFAIESYTSKFICEKLISMVKDYDDKDWR